MSTTASQTMEATQTALAAAEASAELGVTVAQLGYGLTLKALKESTAAAVFPLLLVELGALASGLAAYVAEPPVWALCEARAAALEAAAEAYWRA